MKRKSRSKGHLVSRGI